jgi:hypothetical protein
MPQPSGLAPSASRTPGSGRANDGVNGTPNSLPHRTEVITRGLPLDRPGIEIAPLFSPIVRKDRCQVFYVDVCSAEASRSKYDGTRRDAILDVDVVWTPGLRLRQCVTDDRTFHWGIASHVFEHVPDPLGWLVQVFETMRDGAILSLALPLKDFCFDRFRQPTSAAELIDAWLRGERLPSPRQMFDFTSRAVADGYCRVPGEMPSQQRFEDCARSYTLEQSFHYALQTWQSGEYLDAHCSVFTPDTFKPLFEQFNHLGILNAAVAEPVVGGNEFYVQLTRLGPPRINHPGPSCWSTPAGAAPDAVTRGRWLITRLRHWLSSRS